ncbi:JAB domain-containing protein [Pseudalkalibacillus sp. R45]
MSGVDEQRDCRTRVEAGHMIGVEVLDHLIVNAEAGYTSLKEKGYV